MAEKVVARRAHVKIRNPWGAFALAVVTLGIYYLVWYYSINRELRDFGESFAQPKNPLGDSPGLSLLAITLGGFLLIPPFISTWRTFRRIRKAEELAGLQDRISELGGFVLYLIALILLPFEIPYAQGHLNGVWRHEAAEAEKAALGLRGAPA